MKNQKTTVIISIFAVLLLAITIVCLIYSCKDQDTSQASGGMILDADAESYEPSAALATDGTSGIAIPGYGTVYFPENETDVQLTLYNPEQNTCLFRFELYIDEETEPIATTDLVEAGKAVRSIILSHPLKAGEYTLSIKVLPYTVEDHTPLNNALVRARLCVLADE